MITAVDTSVLIDIFRGDPDYGRLSSDALRRCVKEGQVVACEVVWAELAAVFPSREMLHDAMEALPIEFLPMERAAAVVAGETWRLYRSRGGKRTRVIADFLIPAHAQAQCDRLLTRDRGFYREYFKTLRLVDPCAECT
jgi:predicted nucleic acid-binding protein